MVATPSVTSSSTGESVMAASQSVRRRGSARRTGRLPAAAGSPRSRTARPPAAGPVRRQQLVGQARVGEEELAPLVHQLEAGRERRLVVVVRRPRGAGRPARSARDQPADVRRAAARRGPRRRPARASNRSARAVTRCGAGRPRRPSAELGAAGSGLTQTSVGQRGVAEEGQAGAQPAARRPRVGRRVDERSRCQRPSHVAACRVR